MKTSYPQIAQITQTVSMAARLWEVARNDKTDALGHIESRLCNLRNPRIVVGKQYEPDNDHSSRVSRLGAKQDARHPDDAGHHHRCVCGDRHGQHRAGRTGFGAGTDRKYRHESSIVSAGART